MFKIQGQEGKREQKTNMMSKKNSQRSEPKTEDSGVELVENAYSFKV